jgi:type IV secretory pathway TraG/TraD family ATPase VirD4
MIGSFIVSSIQVETMKRANLSMDERKDFTMYIDEFQNFATESFAVILSEARKYKLSLVVANQYISQVQDEIQNAIFGNV